MPVCDVPPPKAPELAPIVGTPSWAEIWVWGLAGQQFRPVSCCQCAAGGVWAAEPAGLFAAGWRGCEAAARACGGCSSRTRCREEGSCSPCGSARPSRWRWSLGRGPAGEEGTAGGPARAARCLKPPTRCSGSETRCRCCSCRTGRASWTPSWQTGTRWATA